MTASPQTLPPEVAYYVQGVTPQARQFDFIIGDWDVKATKFKTDGSVLFAYKAQWVAQYLNEGRIVMDEFKAFSPTGQQISSYVTLRTFSPATHRWEMTGLAAFQPTANAEWNGIWKDGEMQLDAVGNNPEGKRIKTKIRFFNITPLSFAWDSKTSTDDGATWVRTVSLIAHRTQR